MQNMMMMQGNLLWVLILGIAVAEDSPARNYYIASMFEHAVLGDIEVDSPQEIVQKNLNMYEIAMQVAEGKGANIMVFPELGIFHANTREGMKPYLEEIPDPRNGSYNPCNQPELYSDRPILYNLSCMAKRHKMVLVANMADIQTCNPTEDPNCPSDQVYQYNTNVAFDRDGKLLSRYHKVHLFYEYGTDVPLEPQEPIFSTDFGTFAMFICFDILFKDIVDAAKAVDNVLLPTMWFNTMPFLNSVQLWQAWALGNNVTFLAANIQRPGYNNVGSGVFSPEHGALAYTINPDGLSKLIVSKVPFSKNGIIHDSEKSITVICDNGTYDYSDTEDGKDFGPLCSNKVLGDPQDIRTDYRCLEDNTVNYTFAKLTKKSDAFQLCQNGMCCSLNYSTSSMNDNFYLGVLNQTYAAAGKYFWCLENCMVVRCENTENRTCSTFPLETQTVFNYLELKANFTTKYVYPSVMKKALRLSPMTEWSYALQENQGEILGHLIYQSESTRPLLSAVLNGRCYDRDPPYER